MLKKNMRPGNKFYLLIIIYLFSLNFSIAEDKITTSPLINVEKIQPSYEEFSEENDNISSDQNLKEKKIIFL